jgi:hypothetical protein
MKIKPTCAATSCAPRGRRRFAAGGLLLAAAALLGRADARGPLRRGFLPPNDFRAPAGAGAAGISEADYNAVLDRVEREYAPVVRARGATLSIRRGWKEPMLETGSDRLGNTWGVRVYGAIARHPEMTVDGFALVVCHEIGHHLGGYPQWGSAANEGAADYFATLKCLRRVLKPAPEGAADPTVKAACSSAFPDEVARSLCRRSAMAGLSGARVHQRIQDEPRAPAFATPDPAVVEWMFPEHSSSQCRLDTFFQGALCAKPPAEDVSETDPAAGACTAKGGFRVGLRPRCWYKPPADEPAPAAGRLGLGGPDPGLGGPDPGLGARTRARLRSFGDSIGGRGF